MNAEGLEEFVGGISWEEGHKHVLERSLRITRWCQKGNKHWSSEQASYLITCGFNHKCIWHQERGFSLFDECHRQHGDRNLELWKHYHVRPDNSALQLTFIRSTPWCLCQRLWSGNRSSCRRRTFCPDIKCLSAGRRCNLSAQTLRLAISHFVLLCENTVWNLLCLSDSSLLTSLNNLWYCMFVLESWKEQSRRGFHGENFRNMVQTLVKTVTVITRFGCDFFLSNFGSQSLGLGNGESCSAGFSLASNKGCVYV